MTLVIRKNGKNIVEEESFYKSEHKLRVQFTKATEDNTLSACLVTASGQVKLHNTEYVLLPSWIA